jgi:hypothetical protein
MKRWIIAVLALSVLLCMAACNQAPERPENVETTDSSANEAPTEAPATEEATTETPVTEAPTAEETTAEETTAEETEPEKEEIYHPTLDEVKIYATTVLETEDILATAHNEQQDWSDFGGLTLNEDGSLTALFRYGTDDKWDPYFYLIREDTPVDDVLVIKYRSEYDQSLNLYMGTEGNVAHGGGDNVDGSITATDGDWAYVVIDISERAYCYDADSDYLGYLRFGLANTADNGDTVDFGFVAFFRSMEQVEMVIPYGAIWE